MAMFFAGGSLFLELYYRKIFSNFEHDIADHKLNLASSRMRQITQNIHDLEKWHDAFELSSWKIILFWSNTSKIQRNFLICRNCLRQSKKETMLIGFLCANFRWKGIFDKCTPNVIILSRRKEKNSFSERRCFRTLKRSGKSKRSKTRMIIWLTV